MFSFIGESSALPITIEKGRVFLDERPLEIIADGTPDGPAQLYLRPQDLEVVDSGPGTIPGVVAPCAATAAAAASSWKSAPAATGWNSRCRPISTAA